MSLIPAMIPLGSFLTPTGVVVLAGVKEVFDNVAFRGRIELIGLNKVVLHRIPWTK
jgi:hypothetical protein